MKQRPKTKTQPSPNGDNGRDACGRFTEGNSGGPGNPHARSVARLRSLIVAKLSDGKLDTIVDKLIELAEDGNLQAVKLLLLWGIGKPTDPPCEPDRMDADEYRVLQGRPNEMDWSLLPGRRRRPGPL